MTEITPAEVIAFWSEAGSERWFKHDPVFDDDIRRRFLAAHEQASAGELSAWEDSADGALALLLLLDQFPRNMFRDTPRMFATDDAALAVADRAIARGFDRVTPAALRTFFYVPYMHSEQLAEQERGIELYRADGNDDGMKWALMHADIIRRFSRFPHRNHLLGRETLATEQAFLDAGGFSG